MAALGAPMNPARLAKILSDGILPTTAGTLAELRVRAGVQFVVIGVPVVLVSGFALAAYDVGWLLALSWCGFLAIGCVAWSALARWCESVQLLLHGLAGLMLWVACTWALGAGRADGFLPLAVVAVLPAVLRGLLGGSAGRFWFAASSLVVAWWYFGGALLGLGEGQRLSVAQHALDLLVVATLLTCAAFACERARGDCVERAEAHARVLERNAERVYRVKRNREDSLLRLSRMLRKPLVNLIEVSERIAGSAVADAPDPSAQSGAGASGEAESGAALPTSSHSGVTSPASAADDVNPMSAITRNVRRLQATLELLGDLAEVEAGTLRLRTSRCSLSKLAEELVSTLQVKAEAQGHELELVLGPELPELVDTDPARLKQVLGAVAAEAFEVSQARSFQLILRALGARLAFDLVQCSEPDALEVEARPSPARSAEPGKPQGETESDDALSYATLRAAEVARVRVDGLARLLGVEIQRAELESVLRSSDDDEVLEKGTSQRLYASVLLPVQSERGAAEAGRDARGGGRVRERRARVRPTQWRSQHEEPEGSSSRHSLVWLQHLGLGCVLATVAAGLFRVDGARSLLALAAALVPAAAILAFGSRAASVWTFAALGLAAAGAAGFDPVAASWYARVGQGSAHYLYLFSLLGIGATTYVMFRAYDRATCVRLEGLACARQQLEQEAALAGSREREKAAICLQVGHELRTPLTSILGFADVMLEDISSAGRSASSDLARRPWLGPPRATRRHLSEFRRHGHRMLALIESWAQLLELGVDSLSDYYARSDDAKGAASSEVGTPQAADPAQAAGPSVGQGSARARLATRFSPAELLLQVVERAEEQGLDGVLEIEGILESPIPDWVVGDAVRSEQAFNAFVEHALTVCDEGLLKVSGGVRTSSDPHQLVLRIERQEVSDVALHGSEPEAGAGEDSVRLDLHLSLCKRLVDALGGRLELANLRRRGAASSVIIPVAEYVAQAADEADERASEVEHAVHPARLDLRILVAEDGADNRRLIGHLLKRLGADAVLVENGELALRRALFAEAEQQPFDVILMDLQMPEVDGYEATQTLRDAGFMRPVIALTAHATDFERQRCREAGFDGFAIKPIDQNSLLAALVAARAGDRSFASPRGDLG